MKKLFLSIFFILSLLGVFLSVDAWVDMDNSAINNYIWSSSISNWWTSWDVIDDVNNVWFSLLTRLKIILEWLMVIFLVFVWIQMIISMWSDEEKLSSSKRQLRFVLIALVFINIPWTLYDSFKKDSPGVIDITAWTSISWYTDSTLDWNMFLNPDIFGYTLNTQIIWFIKVIIFGLAVFYIVMEAIVIMTARWREEKVTEAKNKIFYWILALIFVWVIELWLKFVYGWDLDDAKNIFYSLSDLALFFAWPTAIFFLSLASYYYITSSWDEEKIKKAKTIVVNTVLATLILLAAYTFLLDLATL